MSFDQALKQEHYVAVVEFDCSDYHIARYGGEPKRGPLVWESYLGPHSTREATEQRAAALDGTYGRVTTMRLVDPDALDALLNIADRVSKMLAMSGYSPVKDSNNPAESLLHDALAATARFVPATNTKQGESQ